jgi:PEP-CTERM motif
VVWANLAPTYQQGENMNLLNRRWLSRLFLGAASILLLAMFSSAAFAGVIYQYRQDGSPAVIGTLEVASPPASASIGWSTSASSDLIALFLDNAVFGLGSANLLSVGGTSPPEIQSLDGTKLDGGGFGINFPTIFPVDPTDPTIHQSLSISFSPSSGGDLIAVATHFIFPDGQVAIADLFIDGNWVAQLPEPGTLLLLGIGLLAIVLFRTRSASDALTFRRAPPGEV